MKKQPDETEKEYTRRKQLMHTQNYGMKPSLFARLFLHVGQKRRGWSGPRVD
jgi:hypothetical protein